MADQSSLGGRTVNRQPTYNQLKFARVTSTRNFHKYGMIEAMFTDYSQPAPIWVIGDVDREPVEGDFILVGYIEGRRDAPYMVGFVKNKAYTTNFVVVKKDKIKLQLPIFDIGVKDGKAHKDVQSYLLDNGKQKERAYIELGTDYALVSFPTDKNGAKPPGTIKITASEVIIDHPGVVKHHGGGKGVARLGDKVDMNPASPTYGEIITASEGTKID